MIHESGSVLSATRRALLVASLNGKFLEADQYGRVIISKRKERIILGQSSSCGGKKWQGFNPADNLTSID